MLFLCHISNTQLSFCATYMFNLTRCPQVFYLISSLILNNMVAKVEKQDFAIGSKAPPHARYISHYSIF